MPGAPWTEQEEDFVRRTYKSLPCKEIAVQLTNKFGTPRTFASVIGKAQDLGLMNPRGPRLVKYSRPGNGIPVRYRSGGKAYTFDPTPCSERELGYRGR